MLDSQEEVEMPVRRGEKQHGDRRPHCHFSRYAADVEVEKVEGQFAVWRRRRNIGAGRVFSARPGSLM